MPAWFTGGLAALTPDDVHTQPPRQQGRARVATFILLSEQNSRQPTALAETSPGEMWLTFIAFCVAVHDLAGLSVRLADRRHFSWELQAV